MEIDQEPILKHKPPANRLMRLNPETTIPLWNGPSLLFDKKDYEEFVQVLYESLKTKFTKLPFDQRKGILKDKLLKLFELAEKGGIQLLFNSVLDAFIYVYIECIQEMKMKLQNTNGSFYDLAGMPGTDILKQPIQLSMLEMFTTYLNALDLLPEQYKTKLLTKAETAMLEAVKKVTSINYNKNLEASEQVTQVAHQICEELGISKGAFYGIAKSVNAKLIWFYNKNELYKCQVDKIKKGCYFEIEVTQT